MFQWHVVRCGSKNRYQKDMWLKDLDLHGVQSVITMLGSIVDIIKGP